MKRIEVTGQYGIGDCIHQRAVVRELMKTQKVTLQTFYTAMYHDLVEEGLHLVFRGRLEPRIADAGNRDRPANRVAPIAPVRIGYTPEMTREYGSIIAAQYASVGLKCPENPNFRIPVKAEWRKAAREALDRYAPDRDRRKPIMVLRPPVLNRIWHAPARAPDTAAYERLYRSVRDRFFVVSVCKLGLGGEYLLGNDLGADLKLHHGELEFEAMAGLFAEAALVFGNPGFVPILAQAVGTPVICVYGANESYRTTNKPGAHLAPTLAIEPLKPCEHFARYCECKKTIDMEKALPKVRAFAEEHAGKPRVLIFGTTYVDTPERLRLTHQWCELHRHLNPDCDLLLVDSASPLGPLVPERFEGDVEVFSFADNIGHLSRNGPKGPASKGRDGWGRAFVRGLDHALTGGYDFVVHIEGDSLFRKPVMPIVRDMQRTGAKVTSVPVEGTKRKEVGWVETGLMFMDCRYLEDADFINRYDWTKRTERPTPEKVIFGLLGSDLAMMDPLWQAQRGDKSQITVENVTELDWVTHCDDPAIYDRFVAEAMGGTTINMPAVDWTDRPIDWHGVKLNFGCGTNRLEGWENFDAEVDITKRLPFPDDHADYIFAEHVVEHVGYYQALDFLKECRRVLKPGGVVRICVPSVENVMERADQAYIDFVRKWAPTGDLRGAMHAILYAHGHKAPWTLSLLRVSLFFAGFESVVHCEQGQSEREQLRGVEGHHRVIGEWNNWVEAAICEGVAVK